MSIWKKLFGGGAQQTQDTNPSNPLAASTKDQSKAARQLPTLQADDRFWSGAILEHTDDAVKDPTISGKDVLGNAIANAVGYLQEDAARFILQNGRLIGIWTDSFPSNCLKNPFLSTLCSMALAMKEKSPNDYVGFDKLDEALDAALLGRYRIYKDTEKIGFYVRFI